MRFIKQANLLQRVGSSVFVILAVSGCAPVTIGSTEDDAKSHPERYVELVVAKSTIPAESVIQDGDLTTTQVDANTVPFDALPTKRYIAGHKALESITTYETIKAKQVENCDAKSAEKELVSLAADKECLVWRLDKPVKQDQVISSSRGDTISSVYVKWAKQPPNAIHLPRFIFDHVAKTDLAAGTILTTDNIVQ